MVCNDFCCIAIFQIIAIEMASILLLQTIPMAISYGLYSLLMLTLLLVSLPELFALVVLHQLLKGMRWRTKVPAHSREDDELQEIGILRGIAAVVKCPSCDAALDLNKVYSDMTFTCDYCGATGTIELVKTRHHGRD
jgi:hypothetical protein